MRQALRIFQKERANSPRSLGFHARAHPDTSEPSGLPGCVLARARRGSASGLSSVEHGMPLGLCACLHVCVCTRVHVRSMFRPQCVCREISWAGGLRT